MASDVFDVKVEGIEKIVKRLKSLDSKKAKSAMRSSVRVGANEIKKLAVQFVRPSDNPATYENIAKNIIAKTGGARSEKKNGGLVMRIGVMGGAKRYVQNKGNVRKHRVGKKYKTLGSEFNPGGDTYYWRFVEFGTSKNYARPFMRNAAAQGAQPAINAITRDLPKKIDRELAKVN